MEIFYITPSYLEHCNGVSEKSKQLYKLATKYTSPHSKSVGFLNKLESTIKGILEPKFGQ